MRTQPARRRPKLTTTFGGVSVQRISYVKDSRAAPWGGSFAVARSGACADDMGAPLCYAVGDPRNRGSSGHSDGVARVAVAGRVAILLVEADRQVPGRIDETTGDIRHLGRMSNR